MVIDTDAGARRNLLEGNTPRTHAQSSPADPNRLFYCYGGPRWRVQRLWLIHADGTGNRPILKQTNFEGIGHEFWSQDGNTIYSTCNGGRQPQGLWAVNADGSNERCVLAGALPLLGTASVFLLIRPGETASRSISECFLRQRRGWRPPPKVR